MKIEMMQDCSSIMKMKTNLNKRPIQSKNDTCHNFLIRVRNHRRSVRENELADLQSRHVVQNQTKVLLEALKEQLQKPGVKEEDKPPVLKLCLKTAIKNVAAESLRVELKPLYDKYVFDLHALDPNWDCDFTY